MLKKGQHVLGDDESPVALFYALAAQSVEKSWLPVFGELFATEPLGFY
ncbi:MAG: hypothetical protein P8104_04845 [Gammaproteobacteria bacterium]